MRKIELKLLNKRIGKSIPLPYYATSGSAGLDLHNCLAMDTTIQPCETLLIPTGIAINIKDHKLMAVLVPRSGLGHKKGIVLGNSVGIIDSDYQGQVLISCLNRSEHPFKLEVGAKLAQMIFVPVEMVSFDTVKDFSEVTVRGLKGFGSTDNQNQGSIS